MTAPRLWGVLCIRNEASRYLERCLQWHERSVDGLFVFDDQSTDDSAEVARRNGARVEVRPDDVPSFLEHEGAFRQAAWEAFETVMHPEIGDWVLALDADEFLSSPCAIDPKTFLGDVARSFTNNGRCGCKLKIHEVFDVDDNNIWHVRTDGFWGEITGLRFFAYQPGGRFANRRMGCGSAPTYVQEAGQMTALELFHLGYARAEDRIEKYNRYFGLPGHNPRHIASIVTTPTLVPWSAPA